MLRSQLSSSVSWPGNQQPACALLFTCICSLWHVYVLDAACLHDLFHTYRHWPRVLPVPLSPQHHMRVLAPFMHVTMLAHVTTLRAPCLRRAIRTHFITHLWWLFRGIQARTARADTCLCMSVHERIQHPYMRRVCSSYSTLKGFAWTYVDSIGICVRAPYTTQTTASICILH